jgi:hypothetical protein
MHRTDGLEAIVITHLPDDRAAALNTGLGVRRFGVPQIDNTVPLTMGYLSCASTWNRFEHPQDFNLALRA